MEFLYTDVAKIVEETMNNYLMFEKLLKCQIVSTEKATDAIFKNKIDPNRPPALINRLKAKKAVNSKKSEVQEKRGVYRRMASLRKLQAKLSDAGIELALPALPETEKTNGKTTPKLKKAKSQPTTPIMEIDVSDEDIAMKTPPNVKKIRSRPNSAAVTPKSKLGTPSSKAGTPKAQSGLVSKESLQKLETLLMKKKQKRKLK